MSKKGLYDLVNRMVGVKVYHIEGPVTPSSSIKMKIDFQFRISKDVELITRGDKKNYVGIDVKVLKITPSYLDMMIIDIEDNRFEISDKMYYIAMSIENEIRSVLRHFSIEDYPVLTSIKFVGERHTMFKTKQITESKGERGIVRRIVNDIIKILKSKQAGFFNLPDDINGDLTYTFSTTEFDVELSITKSTEMDGYKVDGGYYSDDDTLEIEIIYNPNKLNSLYYNLIGSLNETVRHELEHLLQHERGEEPPTDETDPEKYYIQPHEMDAQIAGFKRLSKLRKQPFETALRNWYEENKDKHRLDDVTKERVINKILDTYKK